MRPIYQMNAEGIGRNESLKPYRFGFLLNTTLGNMTRYLNLRKYAERDADVDFSWAPVSHYTAPDFPSRLRFLPEPLFMRARVIQQAWPVLRRLEDFDAVMIHLFEADVLCALRSLLRDKPLRFSSTDEAPIVDRDSHPLYPHELGKSLLRHKARLALDMWRARHTDYFVPFSQWGADILARDCGVPRDRVQALHVGMDLELWQAVPKAPRPGGQRLRILFVGGDFVRKGGPQLLDVFRTSFQETAELHLVTKQVPAELPRHVHVYDNFQPNDEGLRRLFSQADVMVVPTQADILPWAFMEAMSMGLPIIGTDIGAIREIVRDGETGFTVKVDDREGLRRAIQRICEDPGMAAEMGRRGRLLIEREYSAAKNVPLIIGRMKEAVDRRRASHRRNGGEAKNVPPDGHS